MRSISYSKLNQELISNQIPLTAAELQGFLTGLICGGVTEQNWQPLLFQFTNDNHAYPTKLLDQIRLVFAQSQKQLADLEGFNFYLLLPEENVFAKADALSEWVNHFLLGLGVTQKNLDKETGEIGEALDDLQSIGQLGYDESENKEELEIALEEVVEYVRTIATLFFTHFSAQQMENSKQLH